MTTFGKQLRKYRRNATDPDRGGLLTQERLGELIGHEMGDAGFSGAAISDWERDKSRIHADDRLVLVSIIAVLKRSQGLNTIDEANALLNQGNYRRLNSEEATAVFGAEKPAPPPAAAPASESRATIYVKSPERTRELILLDKVNRFWVKGVLAKSLGDNPMLALNHLVVDEAIHHPWEAIIPQVTANLATEAEQTSIWQTFWAADRALLLLGAPGSGKTTMLIALAQDLIKMAHQDENAPLPVILNLSSWTTAQSDLSTWVVEELTAKYQIPRRLGADWLGDDRLILLLDGLDSVTERHRDQCVTKINQFREKHGLCGLVICSRADDYRQLRTRLRLSGAIELQPLSEIQIQNYLADGQDPNMLNGKPLLRKLVRNPLLLSVLKSADLIEDKANPANDDDAEQAQLSDNLSENGAAAAQGVIFDAYLEQMGQRYPSQRIGADERNRYLTWLARQLDAHHQNQFLFEQLQPSWLPNRAWRLAFILGSRLLDGIAIGFILWLFTLLVATARTDLGSIWDATGRLADAVPADNQGAAWLNLAYLLLLCGGIGLLAGLIDGWFYEHHIGQQDKIAPPPQIWRHTLATIVALGVAAYFFVNADNRFYASAFSIAIVVSFLLTQVFIHGDSYLNDIRVVEALRWSWRGAFIGSLLGLAMGIVVELFEYWLAGPSTLARVIILFTTAFGLIGGLSNRRLAAKSRPNEGMRLSATNAILVGTMVGLPLSLLGAIFFEPRYGVLLGILTVMLAGTLFGGGHVAKHILLRLLLWRSGQMPPAFTDILDEAARQIILYKVGGGYIFIHPLIQDHFVAMHEPELDTNRSDVMFLTT